jgi:protein-S-isoprenylcysteine O-methyltransferase Ste14
MARLEAGRSAVGSAIFFVVAPGAVAGVVPWLLSRWRANPPFLGWPGMRGAGAILVLAGLAVLVESFARFALEGRGTPAPVAPTERLVIGGWYRFVRNPMYVAVLSIIVGQALLFGSVPLLWYAAAVAIGFHLFVVLYEEPTLRSRYGEEYEAYSEAVRRWWPRRTPWRGGPRP